MKWILIFWLFHGNFDSFGTASTAVEFNTEASCKAAFQQIKTVNHGEMYLRGVCVKKEEASK
jgi:hypothetical protein